MGIKVHVIFYSMYGHVYRMAEAVAAGVKEVGGAEATLFQAAEIVPDAILEKSGAKAARAAFAHVPVATTDSLAEPHAIIFGTPTRFGNMCAQMRNLLDQTGGLWAKGTLVGKIGSVFASTATQHGGQETTLTSFHSTLLHHGIARECLQASSLCKFLNDACRLLYRSGPIATTVNGQSVRIWSASAAAFLSVTVLLSRTPTARNCSSCSAMT